MEGPDGDLVALLDERAAAGQHSLAADLRTYLGLHSPGLVALLGHDQDDRFLEPLGFAAAAAGLSSEGELELVYAGALPAGSRPAVLSGRADRSGRLFLPGLGYALGLPASTPVTLRCNDASTLGYSATIGTELPLSELRLRTPGPAVLPYPVPALENAGGTHPNGLRGVEEAAERSGPALKDALDRIHAVWPDLGVLLGRVTRYIVLFDDRGENSFAKTSAHGVAFLNVALGGTPAFFVEDLPHQCGHLVFTATLEGGPPFFSVPGRTTVSDLTKQRDHRTVEIAMHGMVTQTLMVAALDRAQATAASQIEHNELTGRLLFALMRLGLDLRLLAPMAIYSDAGATLMRCLLGSYTAAARKYGDDLVRADFHGQPYNFDYPTYEQRNLGLLVQ